MKCCVIFLFFGVAVQLEASAIPLEKLKEDGENQSTRSTMHFTQSPGTPVERDASSLEEKEQPNKLDVDAETETDGNTSSLNHKEGHADDKHDKKASRSDGRRRRRQKKHSRRSDDSDSTQVLAVGLDTGAPGSKNGIVDAISEAFGRLNISPLHARANFKGDKNQPLSLELKSESLLRALDNFLGSTKVKKLTRDLARKAAVIYRAFEKQL